MKQLKKIIALLIALCLVLAIAAGCTASQDNAKQETPTENPAPTDATAEKTDEPVIGVDPPEAEVTEQQPAAITVSGIVSELGEGYFVLDVAEDSHYQVNYGESTLSNIAVSDIAVGVKLSVTYDGKETRSLPPQIYADTIDVCSVIGTVAEITQEGFILVVSDNLSYEVLPMPDSLPSALPALESGMTVTVLYDGKETRSIPAQITGYKVIVPIITGVIDSVEEGALMLTDETTGNKVLVTYSDVSAFSAGQRVSAVYNGAMTLSLPPQANATHIYTAE